jgi:high-affinity iron transporter
LPITVEFDWIGVGSTWEGIMAQLTILVLFIAYIYRSRRKQIMI